MNLEDLRAAQVDERGTDSLQPLGPTFYEETAAYLADLRDRRDRLADRVDDPFGSAEVRELTDELETAEEVVEALYERRVGKLVKQASLAAAGMPTDDGGLTEEEQELFGALVDRIEANRATILDVLDTDRSGGTATDRGAGGADRSMGSPAATPDSVDDEPSPPTAADAETDPSPEPGGSDADGATEPDGGAPAPVDDGRAAMSTDEPDRLTVRITADVGEIYGVDDRVYTLGAEDVVALPAANAKPLLDRDAAQQLD